MNQVVARPMDRSQRLKDAPSDSEIFAALSLFIIRAEEAGYEFSLATWDPPRVGTVGHR